MLKNILLAATLAAVFSISTVSISAVRANGHDAGVTVTEPFARASAGNVRNGAAFMTLSSGGGDVLLRATSDVARRTELHTVKMEDGVMRMRRVPDIALPAMEKVALKPGGLHVMFMGLKEPLKQGENIDITLTFEKAGDVIVSVPVRGPGAK